MPKYRVTTPSGEAFEVNTPDGATEQDAIRYVQSNMQQLSTGLRSRRPVEQSQQEPSRIGLQPRRPVEPANDGGVNLAAMKQRRPDDFSIMDNLKDSFLGGAVRGARDIVDGGAQLLTRGLEAVAPAGSDFERFMQEERRRVEGINQGAEQDYQHNWRRGVDPGLDPGRIAGNIAATLPVSALAGPAAMAAAPVRTAATVGAVTGALQPTFDPDSFGEDKFGQVAFGAIGGAAAPKIASVLGNTAAGIKTRIANIMNKAPRQTAAQRLASEGIPTQGLNPQMVDELAKRASTGGQINRDALERLRDFERLGMKSTQGQITRDPRQFQFEYNTRGRSPELSERFATENSQLIERAKALRKAMPAAQMDAQDAGQLGIGALDQIDAARRAAIGSNYDDALNSIGASSPLDGTRIIQRIVNDLDNAEMNALGGVPDDIMAAIQKEAGRTGGITVGSAEALKKGINARIASADPAGRIPLNKVKDIIDDEISVVGLQAGDQAAAAFRKARASAAERFENIKKSPAMQRIVKAKEARGGSDIDAVDPVKFVNDMIVRGKPRDLMGLRMDLQGNQPEVWEQMRAQAVDWLNDRAIKDGVFNHSAFKKALDAMGAAKQKILFTKAELAQLQRIKRVAGYINVPPTGAVINYSNTAQTLMEQSPILNLPGLGPLLRMAKGIPEQFKGRSAVNVGVDQVSTAPTANLPPELIRALSISSNPALQPFLRPEVGTQ